MTDLHTADEIPGGIDRRSLIKRAAAVGAVGWTAPLIVDSFTPAAAQSAAPGCWKFMYDFVWAEGFDDLNGPCSYPDTNHHQNDAAACSQNFGENHANQLMVEDSNCCDVDLAAPLGQEDKWNQMPDIAAGCVTVTVTPGNCAANPDGANVTIEATCPDCWLNDGIILYGSVDTDPATCGTVKVEGSNGAGTGSNWFKRVTIDFSAGKRPIWVKYWVGCGFNEENPPDFTNESDCDFLDTLPTINV